MAITHQQFVALMAEKLNSSSEEISGDFSRLIEAIRAETAQGGRFAIDRFGTFLLKDGRLSFETDSTFALEINYKYAGMTPVELRKEKTPAAEHVQEPVAKEPDQPAGEKKEDKPQMPPKQTEEVSVPKPAAEKKAEPKPVESVRQKGTGEGRINRPRHERRPLYRSPNHLIDDDVPKRRAGLFVVIAVILAIILVGYFVIMNHRSRQGQNSKMVSGAVPESTYSAGLQKEDNSRPAVRDPRRTVPGGISGSAALEPADRSLPDETHKSAGTNVPSAGAAKKAVPIHPDRSRAAADSVVVQDIMNDLSGASLYGLRGSFNNEVGDYYTIVIASLKDKSRARKTGDKWKALHYRVVIAPAQIHEQTWWRVGLGQFATIAEAQKAVPDLPDRLQDPQHHFIHRIH